jgi:ATP-dependent DNA ligase
MHVEGIVSKRLDAPYTPSNRGLWRKVKCLNREEFVVVGWTDPEGSHILHSPLICRPHGRPSDRQRQLGQPGWEQSCTRATG